MWTIVYKHLLPVVRVFGFYMAEFHKVLEHFCDLLFKCLPVAFCKLRKNINTFYVSIYEKHPQRSCQLSSFEGTALC